MITNKEIAECFDRILKHAKEKGIPTNFAKGKWIKKECCDDDTYVCSECGAIAPWLMRNCYWCGATMEIK